MNKASRPPRARGLKHAFAPCVFGNMVAPPAGAWIETKISSTYRAGICRAPRGRVD